MNERYARVRGFRSSNVGRAGFGYWALINLTKERVINPIPREASSLV